MPGGTIELQKAIVVGKVHIAIGILVNVPVLGTTIIFGFGVVPNVGEPDVLDLPWQGEREQTED